jgi:hypothetical protein
MDKFLHTYDIPKSNQENINNLCRSIMNNEIEAVTESHNQGKPKNTNVPQTIP